MPERLSNQAAQRGPLHSILKKPNAAPKEIPKTTRWLIEDTNADTSTCEPVDSTTAITSATDVSTSRHSHKKTQFVASKTAKGSKRRPVMLRRKSSQSTSGLNLKSTRTQSLQRGPFTKRAEKAEEYVDPEVHLPDWREATRSPSPELKGKPFLGPMPIWNASSTVCRTIASTSNWRSQKPYHYRNTLKRSCQENSLSCHRLSSPT